MDYADLFCERFDRLDVERCHVEGESWMAEQADLSLAVYVGYIAVVIVLGIVFLRWRYSPRDDS